MESQTLSPIQAHEAIAKAAASPNTARRIVEQIAVGEHCRQGDIYLERIRAREEKWLPTVNRQLAPGTSQGSRHIVEGAVKLFTSPEARPTARSGDAVRLLGPQIEAPEAFTVAHPEHAHITLPAGIYQVSYQLDWAQQSAVRD